MITWLGAYPSPSLLTAGRLVITLLLPSRSSSCTPSVTTSRAAPWVCSPPPFAANPVVLLHARRAMAEGPLSWVSHSPPGPCSKPVAIPGWPASPWPWPSMPSSPPSFYSSLASWPPAGPPGANCLPGATILKNTSTLTLAFIVVTLAFNPLYWRHPFQAARSALSARSQLMSAQATGTTQIAPEKAMTASPNASWSSSSTCISARLNTVWSPTWPPPNPS